MRTEVYREVYMGRWETVVYVGSIQKEHGGILNLRKKFTIGNGDLNLRGKFTGRANTKLRRRKIQVFQLCLPLVPYTSTHSFQSDELPVLSHNVIFLPCRQE